MVGRSRAHLDGQANALAVGELVGVHAKPEAAAAPGLEDLPGGLGTEGPLLTKDVAPPRLRCTRLEHGSGDEGDVLVFPAPVLRSDDMGAEVGDLLRDLLGDLEADAIRQ